jgi:oxalate---CoA ligase
MIFLIPPTTSIVELATETTWNADALNQAISKRARALQVLGIGPKDRVVIHHGGNAAFFVDLYAVWRLGGCALCVSASMTLPEIKKILEFTDTHFVLTTKPAELSGLSAAILDTSSIFEKTPETDTLADDVVGADLDDLAFMLFTSGTTGVPKAVTHTFRSLIARLALNTRHIGKDVLKVTLNVLPTHFGHGLIGNCLTPIFAGCSLVMGEGVNVKTASKLGQVVDQHKITFMSSVPALWKLVIKVSKRPTKSMLRVQVGSAPLSKDLWDKIVDWTGTRAVYNLYGITETANWFAGGSAEDDNYGDGFVGQPWGGTAAVLTEDGKILATGSGEILIQSPSLMTGYFQHEELTSNVLKNGWFHTGDIGRVDEAGSIWLTGRQKYEINRAGIKIHPEDLDILVEESTLATEACAFAIPDEIIGEMIGLAVVPEDHETFDLQGLKNWCGERLMKEKMPDKWFVVDEIPKTDRGKINRDNVASFCLKPRNNR